jgi:hypothetical protein
LQLAGLRVLADSAVVAAAAVAVSAHVATNSANGAVAADVTLDNEGPETNGGSSYREKARSKSRRLESPQLAPVTTLSATMTPCARDQL